MTVSAQTTVNSSTGNGVTTVFPYAFKIIAAADLEVLVDGVIKTLTTDYTVSGAGVDTGGDVTFLAAPANGTAVVRRRNMQFLRAADYQYQGDLPNSVLNPDLDAPVMMAQQLQEQVSRSARGPAGETWTEIPAAANRLDLFPVFDATTGALELSTVTQTQVASAVAAAYAAGSAADAVTFLQSGTGAVARSVQSRLRDVVWLHDFGSTAEALQAAINEVQGVGGTVLIRGNTTVALGATGINITGSVRLVGVGGRGRVTISWTDTTMFAFTVACAGEVHFEGITFSGPSGASAGGAISLSGSGGVANSRSKIQDCTFIYGHRAVYAPDAYAWTIRGNTFSGAILYGIYVGCTTDVDAGDSIIEGNTFANLGSSCSAVYQVSSGGLRVQNNKFNGGAYAYLMDMASGAVTSILMIQNNSIENQNTAGIRLLNTAGGGTMTHAMIQNNMFANIDKPININPGSTGFLSLVTIQGNSISGTSGGSTALITVSNATKTSICGNSLDGFGTAAVGITVNSAVTSSDIRDNLINGCLIDVADASTNTIASANALVIPSGKDDVIISGNTAVLSINLGKAIRGRTVRMTFTGTPTVTHGSNIALGGSANFVATVGSVLQMTCFDGVNFTESGRSAP